MAQMPGGNNGFRRDFTKDRFFLRKTGFSYKKNRFVVKSFDILRQESFCRNKTDFLAGKTIFLREKSICCEIFRHLRQKKLCRKKNGFCCEKPDFLSRKFDLLRNPSTFNDRKPFLRQNDFFLREERFCCKKSESFVNATRQALKQRAKSRNFFRRTKRSAFRPKSPNRHNCPLK
jgi:hypothetical protein